MPPKLAPFLALLLLFSPHGVEAGDPLAPAERAAARAFRGLFQRGLSPAQAKRAGPKILKVMGGLARLRRRSQPIRLLCAESATSYAFAFLEDDEPKEARALYKRAQVWAAEALRLRRGSAVDALLTGDAAARKIALASLDRSDLPGVFWLAFPWGLQINIDRASSRSLAQIERVKQLLEWVVKRDESFFNAGPHLALGLLDAAFPKAAGGDLGRAGGHFAAVDRITGGRWLINKVIRARHYSVGLQRAAPGADAAARRKAQERAWSDFFTSLEAAAQAPDRLWPSRELFNKIAKRKAWKMLQEADEYLLPPPGARNPYARD